MDQPWAGLLFKVGEGGLFSQEVPKVTPSQRAQEPLKSGLACEFSLQEWPREGSVTGRYHSCWPLLCFVRFTRKYPSRSRYDTSTGRRPSYPLVRCVKFSEDGSVSVWATQINAWGTTLSQPSQTQLAPSRHWNLSLPSLGEHEFVLREACSEQHQGSAFSGSRMGKVNVAEKLRAKASMWGEHSKCPNFLTGEEQRGPLRNRANLCEMPSMCRAWC